MTARGATWACVRVGHRLGLDAPWLNSSVDALLGAKDRDDVEDLDPRLERLVGYSPLSRLVELEFLVIGITGKLGIWRSLQDVLEEPLTSADLASMIERADRQRTEVDEYRLRAANGAFRAGSTATVSSNP